ncbi:MAG TPA: EscU/YscU/HrcU family type III secretion system export apparatus switch protein [Polyangiaceae bacterium]|nr:EscU/YscU/HrcU family type III secretion system export apparatus switch protein [Polyangiaceae bacterium]
MAENADKTEKATPQRRKKAREQGDFPKSRDASGLAASLAVLLALGALGPSAMLKLWAFSTRCFSEPFDLVGLDPSPVVVRTTAVLAALAVPGAICAALAGVAVGFAQAGFHPNFDLVFPKAERLDPFGKLKQMFAPTTALFELVQSVVRVAVVGYVVYWTLKDMMPVILELMRADVSGAAGAIKASLATLTMRATGVLALLAGADYAFSKYRWEKRNMMSKQELKDEFKQAEGDQRVKAQQRAAARRRLKRGLVKQIKTADVIVVNPTHVSAALRYKAAEGAPVLVAKGYDEVALHIREIAREAKIPIVENVTLARAIASRVRVGKAIPVDLYAAVAEVLAFVYRLRAQRGQQQPYIR